MSLSHSSRCGGSSTYSGLAADTLSPLHKVAINQELLVAFSCILKLDFFHFQAPCVTKVEFDPSDPISALPYSKCPLCYWIKSTDWPQSLPRFASEWRQLTRMLLSFHSIRPSLPGFNPFVTGLSCVSRPEDSRMYLRYLPGRQGARSVAARTILFLWIYQICYEGHVFHLARCRQAVAPQLDN